MICPHLDEIRPVEPGLDVCPACVAIGATWVNRRQCLVCGVTGCCDSSANTHATRHFQESGHPVMRSVMPGQDWTWCYVCRRSFRPVDGALVPIDAAERRPGGSATR